MFASVQQATSRLVEGNKRRAKPLRIRPREAGAVTFKDD
jgi:hypothetical protein